MTSNDQVASRAGSTIASMSPLLPGSRQGVPDLVQVASRQVAGLNEVQDHRGGRPAEGAIHEVAEQPCKRLLPAFARAVDVGLALDPMDQVALALQHPDDREHVVVVR